MSKCPSYDNLVYKMVSWASGVLEDDPLPYGIDEIVFVMDNNYPNVGLYMQFFELIRHTVHDPLESQFFFDTEFINLNIEDNEALSLMRLFIERLLENNKFIDFSYGVRLKVKINGKKRDFLEQLR